MCGFFGTIGEVGFQQLQAAIGGLKHRGPDFDAHKVYRSGGTSVTLAHTRLSIVDLSEAAVQPMELGQQYAIVFNGEIYNYKELSLDFIGELTTSSDTEVLLLGLIRYGLKFLDRVNGMYSFAFLDCQTAVLTLARDPFGIKPLYYFSDEGKIIGFASEIAPLLKGLDRKAEPCYVGITEFFHNGFVHEPNTVFQNVYRVSPGCSIQINLKTDVVTHRQHFNSAVRIPASQADFEERLVQQVNLESSADVDVGVFFSGGIDSTAILCASRPGTRALFADFGDGVGDSRDRAIAICKHLGHEIDVVPFPINEYDGDTVISQFYSVAERTDECISDFTYYPSHVLAVKARQRGYKVMLSGMGGDEFFGGYRRYRWLQYRTQIRAFLPVVKIASHFLGKRRGYLSRSIVRLNKFLHEEDVRLGYSSLVGYFNSGEVFNLLGHRAKISDYNDRVFNLCPTLEAEELYFNFLRMERLGFLSHNLTVADRSSMATGVELRVPLVSRQLFDYSDEATKTFGSGKRYLKEFIATKLPRSLIGGRKIGFNPPLASYIDVVGFKRVLSTIGSVDNSPINFDFAEKLAIEHFSGLRDNSYRLWQLIYFSMYFSRSFRK